MTEDAQFTKEPAIRLERLLPAPIESIWECLTDTTQLAGWYGDGEIEPMVGGAVTIMGGHIRGVVTQWKPMRRVAYTWNVFNPNEPESDYPESYLTIDLKQEGGQVLLTLTHLPVLERFEKQNAMGWHTFLDMLAATVRNEVVKPRRDYMVQNAKRYGVDLANLVS